MPKKALGSSLDFARDLRPGNAEPLLQVLFVADEHVHVLDDAVEHLDSALSRPPEMFHSFAR